MKDLLSSIKGHLVSCTALVWTVNPVRSKLRSSQDASAVSGALPLAQFTDIHSPEHSSAGRDHTKRLQHSQRL